eukprot:TRINITY_DN5012_c0_g1_i2.p1 TRINITY_DN5012_c0_g1~~TRINITY_DN5012_c0_g1_i2.p1  ORF type:complete len:167 (+),score=34.92 TRINITY_DN5012_c0_g1_i2:280-780(+)
MGDSAKEALVARLLEAKKKTSKTFTQIAKEIGYTNAYTAQLFHRQAPLKPTAVAALRKAVPTLTDDLIEEMQVIPLRTFDPNILQDPTIYRFYEAIVQYGVSLKAILNEEAGDGIMSAIGFYCDAEKVKGKEGEDRFVISLNGKYLPHVEQRAEDHIAPVSRLAPR